MVLKGAQGSLEQFKQLLMCRCRVAVRPHPSNKRTLPLNDVAALNNVPPSLGEFPLKAIIHGR